MAANMYRVGDYVYFENSSSNPYLIRRIEELNKTANGNVEAKVVCLFRRRDISGNLNTLADSNARDFEEESKQPTVSEQQKHQLKHRELFLSRQFESLPATHIRGKCNVTLLNETDVLAGYLEKEECFFYSLVFDPVQKTLLADQGEIRVGSKYQAEIPDKLAEGEEDTRIQEKLEVKVWHPDNQLKDPQIDQFLVVARAVGTFARALDCSSSIRQPSLHMSAAAASRDITLFHAMDTLQKNDYDLAKAMSTLVPQGGPVLCRDEMEEWSASEAMLFEEALEKYGKDFNDIRQDFLPWKSLASVVQFYYMWKTTDRYIQQKRLKAAEADSKLKQVYIPTYLNCSRANAQSPSLPRKAIKLNRLPLSFGCFRSRDSQLDSKYSFFPKILFLNMANVVYNPSSRCFSNIYSIRYPPGQLPIHCSIGTHWNAALSKHEALPDWIFLRLSPATSVLLYSQTIFLLFLETLECFLSKAVNYMHILASCPDKISRLLWERYFSKNENTAPLVTKGFSKNPGMSRCVQTFDWYCVMKRGFVCDWGSPFLSPAIQAPLKLKAPRGTPTPINRNQANQPRGGSALLGKRPFDSSVSTPRTRMHTHKPQPPFLLPLSALALPFPTNGRPFTSGMRTTSQSVIKRQKVNQGDAPNPVVFVATKYTRALRKHLTQSEMRRAARKPHLPVRVKLPLPPRPLALAILPSSTSEPIVLED
ncbi:unnamed protein product [Oncorhynchus mykiss]|uniref:Metastasis-associated protein MTA2 n=1 Tax=Oncorhynchus mykiss TaxID=8022 RepID=A0A060XCM5_ONCMY|nr:unnamed protein product [Oncorhynchus mykiss]